MEKTKVLPLFQPVPERMETSIMQIAIAFLIQFTYFLIYSFIGWICETVFCSVSAGKFINRGFISGPLCPIYGFGALMVLNCLGRYHNDIAATFVFSMVGASVIEYITSYVLEKAFQLSLWDYSDHRWNINGRVCLRNSILFGMMSVLMVCVINPFVHRMLDFLPLQPLCIISLFFLICVIADTAITVNALMQLDREAGSRQMQLNQLAKMRDAYREDHQKKLRNPKLWVFKKRIFQAFPRIRFIKYPDGMREMRAEFKQVVEEVYEKGKQYLK